MLPSYFDFIFVHLRQKACHRLELSPKFFSTLGPKSIRKVRADLQLWFIELDDFNNCIRKRMLITQQAEVKVLVLVINYLNY